MYPFFHFLKLKIDELSIGEDAQKNNGHHQYKIVNKSDSIIHFHKPYWFCMYPIFTDQEKRQKHKCKQEVSNGKLEIDSPVG